MTTTFVVMLPLKNYTDKLVLNLNDCLFWCVCLLACFYSITQVLEINIFVFVLYSFWLLVAVSVCESRDAHEATKHFLTSRTLQFLRHQVTNESNAPLNETIIVQKIKQIKLSVLWSNCERRQCNSQYQFLLSTRSRLDSRRPNTNIPLLLND